MQRLKRCDRGEGLVSNMSCNHVKCACEAAYMYRQLRGKSVFTGFVQKGGVIFWVGKDEKTKPPRRIDETNEEDCAFFLTAMSIYEDFGTGQGKGRRGKK